MGASNAHRLTPLAVMKLPMLHWATKGMNRKSPSWIRRKLLKSSVFR